MILFRELWSFEFAALVSAALATACAFTPAISSKKRRYTFYAFIVSIFGLVVDFRVKAATGERFMDHVGRMIAGSSCFILGGYGCDTPAVSTVQAATSPPSAPTAEAARPAASTPSAPLADLYSLNLARRDASLRASMPEPTVTPQPPRAPQLSASAVRAPGGWLEGKWCLSNASVAEWRHEFRFGPDGMELRQVSGGVRETISSTRVIVHGGSDTGFQKARVAVDAGERVLVTIGGRTNAYSQVNAGTAVLNGVEIRGGRRTLVAPHEMTRC